MKLAQTETRGELDRKRIGSPNDSIEQVGEQDELR